jgi:hypothetical protein
VSFIKNLKTANIIKTLIRIKMGTNQIKEKIRELENWLIENPNSPERNLIESDVKKLRTLIDKNHE